MRTTPFRRLRTVAPALAVTAGLAVSLAACSGDSSPADKTSGQGTGQDTETVQVTHTMGTTDIPRNPGKVLSLSPSFTDAFSALGRPVDVEFRSDFNKGTFPWENHDSRDVVTYPMGSPDIEKIADAHPDVIFAGYLPDTASYDRLNAIAPTVGTVGGSLMSDDWRQSTKVAGEVIGKSGDADKLITAAEKAFTDTKAKYPALDGATGAFGQVSQQGLAVVTGDTDPANVFLSDLGVVIPDNIKAASQDGSRAFISPENSDLLNTDLLIMWPVGLSEKDVPTKVKGWDQLTPVKKGTTFFADNTSAGAINPPTILSVAWALTTLDPVFAALGGTTGS